MASSNASVGAGTQDGSSSRDKEVGSSGVAMSGTAGARSKQHKTAAGMRTDVAWQHGVSVSGDARRIKCKYCEFVCTGGVYRFKHHLACTKSNVQLCVGVPDNVRLQMFAIVAKLQERHLEKTNIQECEGVAVGGSIGESLDAGKRKMEEVVETPATLFKKKGKSTQSTINSIFKKSLREEACLDIASFFYNNAIPFNVVKSEEFQKMCDMIARHGIGFKPPSYHEIRVKYLKQKVEMTNKILEEHKATWKQTGCTIMTDGWTDKRRRTILNFLVNSPKGTVFLKSIDASSICKTADKIFNMLDKVVEEVREENVV